MTTQHELSDQQNSIDHDKSKVKDVSAEIEKIGTHFRSVRESHGYTQDRVWGDAKIENAAEGVVMYKKVYEEASPVLRQYLETGPVTQAFLGVLPVLHVANEHSQSNDLFLMKFGVPEMTLELLTELTRLLEKHADGKIAVERIDARKVQYVERYNYEMVNSMAIRTVASQNGNLFPEDQADVAQWVVEHPEEWPMTPQGTSDSARLREIRSGVLSGFPRDAANKYAESVSSPIDIMGTLKRVVLGAGSRRVIARKVEHTPIRDAATQRTLNEAALSFVPYSADDVEWAKEALALRQESRKLLEQRNVS